jgi:sugar (pentulose or hexulose) kinase/phosphoglycerate dehydrogenase-like enzyme/ribulose-5-phosphate 4-epimerase/fuculose-1-phosphate aldolase
MSTYVIGLDVGGGGGRALLLDLHSGETLDAHRPWRFEIAPGTGGLGFDLDLEMMWHRLAEATRDVVSRAGASPGDVLGIATSALRLGNVMLDADGEALFAVPNRDARAVGPGLMLGANHGELLYRRTGRWPYPIHAAARLQWLKAEQPETFERITHLLSISDWLNWKLCGERATDATQAGETLLYDLEQRAWADDLLDTLELPREILPQVVDSGQRLGGLTSEAAAELGLREGMSVAVGGADTQCGLLGAGACAPGEVAAVAGTTGPVQRVTASPLIDDQMRLWTGHHVIPGRYVLESNSGPLGETLDWFGRLLHPDSPTPVTRLFAEAARSKPGAVGMLSSLGGEVMNARAMGLPVGNLTLTHLSSIHDPSRREHLSRAIVEGLACSIRANLEQIADVAGDDASPLRLTGGLSRSDSFAKVLAGVLAGPVDVPAHPGATVLGAAICASVGARVFPDLETASTQLVRMKPRVQPEPEHATDYDALYTRWSSLRSARAPADAEASTLILPFAIGHGQTDVTVGEQSVRPRILVAADFDAASVAALRSLGDVEYASFREKKRMLTGPALVEALQGYQVFITEIDLVDAASIEQLPELRVVGTCRGDAVNVDIDACTAFGIPVLNAPGRNADSVADLTLGFMLMLARKFPEAGSFLHEPGIRPGDMAAMGKAFGSLQGRELWRKTIGLVGLGAVGRKVAERLRGFGARLLVSDPFVDAEQAALADAEVVPLDRLLEESDFVSLHAAVTPETTGLLGARELELMKPGSYLINTARAALVDEEELIAALNQGGIAGAALDTFAVEPPGSDHPFMSMPNVISTPHVGGNTVDVAAHQGEIMVTELERLLAGQRPNHSLNPEAMQAFEWSAARPTPSAEVLARLKEGPAPAVTDLQKKKKKKDKKESDEKPHKAKDAASGTPTTRPDASAPARSAEVPPEITEKLTAILEGFVSRILGDAAVRAFGEDKDVTLHFILTDVGLEFYFRLAAGDGLAGAVGAPEESADVQLRMRAALLDGMFTGTANPMEAAMEGGLSFTGDAAKAMTLQHMQADLERLYTEARAAVGDPGDLDALPDPAAGGVASAPAPSPGANDPRSAIVAIVEELYEGRVVTGTGGNVSTRVPGAEEIWITPSRLFKGDLSPEVMVRTDLGGRPLDPGSRSPSSEWDMHCEIYRRRPEVKAVIHAHAPHATILANAGLPFPPISTEAAFFDDLPRVPFIMPGTPDLAVAVADAVGNGWAALLINHGLLVCGRSLRSAADMVEIIERSSELILGCHSVGKQPPVLPPEIVKTLRAMGDLIA